MIKCGRGKELKVIKPSSSTLGSQKRMPKTEKSRIGNKSLLFRDKDNFSKKREREREREKQKQKPPS